MQERHPKAIRVEKLENKAVVLLTLDRPPVNAMDSYAYREFAEVFTELSQDSALRAVVLTGAGEKAFIAGSDVREFSSMTPANALDRAALIRSAFEAMRRLPVPLIGALNGAVIGSGIPISAGCDILLASENAYFSLPEIDRGVLGGTRQLAQLIPPNIMRWMAFTGKPVGVSRFHEFGSVHDVVPRAKLLDTALDLAREIAGKSPSAMRLQKEAISLSERMDPSMGYHVEQLFTAILSGHPHAKEAAAAFLEKRKPNFE